MLTGVRVMVCTQPQDMRRSFDTLAGVVASVLGESPQSGTLYVFFGKGKTRVKVLWWDKNGYCLLAKRLHRAQFVFALPHSEVSVCIDGLGLQTLLRGEEKQRRVRKKVKEKQAPALH